MTPTATKKTTEVTAIPARPATEKSTGRASKPARSPRRTSGGGGRAALKAAPAGGGGAITKTTTVLNQGALRARVAEWRGEYEERLAALVEIPTVSMDPTCQPAMARAAELARQLILEAGGQVEIVETGGYPMVVGRLGAEPGLPTVTVYNHLDVQPAEASEWRTPPFAFTRDGDRYYARGATDDKGPALAALFGARLARETGARINIQFLWELEEEIGSPNFARGLTSAIGAGASRGPGGPRGPKEPGDAAQTTDGAATPAVPGPVEAAGLATDSVVVSDTIWTAAGKPSIPYGLRGLMGFTVALQTGEKDVHSGTTGGAARNPVAELAALVGACMDARTGRVKIPGFYGGVQKLTAAERVGFGRAGFTAKKFRAAHELRTLRPHRSDFAVMESIMARPTFEVHGLVGGYTGPGIKTIVPHRAELKLSTRLVAWQKPEAVFRLVKAFIKKQIPDAEVTHQASLAPYLAPLGGPFNAAGAAAMRETFGKEPGFTREGGSIGAVLTMEHLLGAPVNFLGLSLPEHGYHAINENFDWPQASGGIEMFCRYFHHLATLPAGRRR